MVEAGVPKEMSGRYSVMSKVWDNLRVAAGYIADSGYKTYDASVLPIPENVMAPGLKPETFWMPSKQGPPGDRVFYW